MFNVRIAISLNQMFNTQFTFIHSHGHRWLIVVVHHIRIIILYTQ